MKPQLSTAKKKRFAELRHAIEIWGRHEITDEEVLLRHINFELGKRPAWTLIDLTGQSDLTSTYLGSNAVEALTNLERIIGTQRVICEERI